MKPLGYLSLLIRGWVWIVLGAVICLILAGAYTWTKTPLYTASTSVFFSVSGGDSVTQLLEGSTFAQNQVTSYALLVEQPVVLQPVIDQLKLNESPKQLSAQIATVTAPETVVLKILVSDPSAQAAADIANAVTTQLAKTVSSLSSGAHGSASQTGGPLTVKATTVAPATVPQSPSSPDWIRNLLAGLLGGAFIGAAYVVLREILSTRVRTEDDVTRVSRDVPVLGTVAQDSNARRQPVLLPGDRGARAEALRLLRSNLEFVNYSGQIRSVTVTSALPNEGKTITATNLALSMSEGQRVILIDADLRNPSVAAMLDIDGSVGLSGLLSGKVNLSSAITRWGRTKLDVIPAGHRPPNPSELVGSEAMSELIRALLEDKGYDLVVLDTAPVLPVSDATVLARLSDGAIVVVSAKVATREKLGLALRTLSRSGSRVLGVVLNQTAKTHGGYGKYDAYRSGEPASATTTSHADNAKRP
ncbi:MAG: polysaccharide biosynthesis tyrosine autokinase [Candidatus Nanopelagicales bacterium]